MLSEVSFVYGRFAAEAAVSLEPALGLSAYSWVKREWLEVRERRLVELLRPMCNSVTYDYRDDVSVPEFVAALKQEMERPLAPYAAEVERHEQTARSHRSLERALA